MIDINKINDIQYVIDNYIEAKLLVTNLKNTLDSIADLVKRDWDIETDTVLLTTITKLKFKPRDINKVLEKYPYDLNSDIYNITINANAKNVIKEPDLLETVIEKSIKVNPL